MSVLFLECVALAILAAVADFTAITLVIVTWGMLCRRPNRMERLLAGFNLEVAVARAEAGHASDEEAP